ncbi:hypothetical protein F4703DRAFT_1926019 [Phycomyces blakesleeanus]|uniref:Uncharacterized protein n=2 Tax=Phycomyces blakesleeanus TaxID=4837 RepID=A0A167LEC9_PHYB8|nr:hypothetical protein PHYBLDRAFT_182549 [Phycomyces blakesleeanus NRRL 1555(-)]OAD70267.1 hypothetical protein PHYBLDRAFT_182549 [Phycomyces blakesleeanus NRRL 1555(-)]|eukprot:XP_018288307.1 hypothetical protein PHYBLDRAFT_182549 [Phycomyces blakesleeanus NRRL 1555(-)]
MATFQVVLRQGITGGIVGPVTEQVVEIRGDHNTASILHANLQPGSKTDYVTQTGNVSTQELQDALLILRNQLAELPLEEPTGSQDIYGQDVSIGFFSNDFQWQNGGPEGCNQGESSVQATPEQKEKFKALVKLVVGLGEQHALTAQA